MAMPAFIAQFGNVRTRAHEDSLSRRLGIRTAKNARHISGVITISFGSHVEAWPDLGSRASRGQRLVSKR